MSDLLPLKTVADLLSALPKQLKIGINYYEIVLHNFSPDDSKWADINCEDHVIRVEMLTPSHERLVESVLHEILHGIYDARSIEKTCDEETIVQELAIGLITFLQDNPRMWDWFKRGLKRRRK